MLEGSGPGAKCLVPSAGKRVDRLRSEHVKNRLAWTPTQAAGPEDQQHLTPRTSRAGDKPRTDE